jgi:type I restriction-modification system DNA methylase subunit
MKNIIILQEEMNERITEQIVRAHFINDGLYRSIKLEEQRTKHKIISELLKKASKKGTGKAGFPEFIITFPALMDSVILVECKPDTKLHRSIDGGLDITKYAVDGVLFYSSFLKQDFNVIAIAVSGENQDSLLVSNFYRKKGSTEIKELPDRQLLSIYNYLKIFEEKETIERLKDQNLLLVAADLNQELYEEFIPENERATIVSGILIALQNQVFKKSYPVAKKPSELVQDLLVAIKRVLEEKNMGEKTPILMGEYAKIAQSRNLAISETIRNKDTGEDEPNTLLRDLIFELDKKVFPFTEYDHMGYDILGQFYSEFIRYVYGDKKLGLVLTPQHVTELFVDIADLNVNDVLYDSCCGTAGFLIKGMKKLTELAANDEIKKKTIQETQVIGVETRSDMFTYSCSNMMMRGDGKSNIHLADSLSQSTRSEIKTHKPTVGFLNPPFSTGVPELEFVYYNLDCIEENKGRCVAIVPLNCVNAQKGKDYDWKVKLLEKHTLIAVFSMPNELFNPASSTITAIVVFKAHIPHPSDYETYFGYWKDDGFIKIKHLGRIDYFEKWKSIKSDWIYNYRNGKEIKRQSIKKCVTAKDEWCAEAYLETDYSQLKKEDFESEIKKYVLFKEMS